MRIAILVEGKTEKAFKPYLLSYLQKRLAGKMPKLDFVPYDGRIPTGDKLKRVVENLLNDKKQPADAVIALTDVYTGSIPPEFPTAEAAKKKMREWVGAEKRFYPHVALHDFEAWLLPYWEKIKRLTGSNRKAPGRFPREGQPRQFACLSVSGSISDSMWPEALATGYVMVRRSLDEYSSIVATLSVAMTAPGSTEPEAPVPVARNRNCVTDDSS